VNRSVKRAQASPNQPSIILLGRRSNRRSRNRRASSEPLLGPFRQETRSRKLAVFNRRLSLPPSPVGYRRLNVCECPLSIGLRAKCSARISLAVRTGITDLVLSRALQANSRWQLLNFSQLASCHCAQFAPNSNENRCVLLGSNVTGKKKLQRKNR